MKFTLETTTTYIPDLYGNLDLTEDEQISVEIEVPSASLMSALFKTDGATGAVDTSRMHVGVSRLVKSIKNVEVNGRKVTDGKELVAATGMYMLVQNIGAHILGMMVDVKKDPS